MKSQVLLTVWCNISGEAAEEIWHWLLLGVKGLKAKNIWKIWVQLLKSWVCILICTDTIVQIERSATFPGHCLQSELWLKYCVKKVFCWQKWNSNRSNFLKLYMCSILFGNIPHETYNAAVISRCPSCQVTLQYSLLGFNASWLNPHHCEKYIVMTALNNA